ncbi:hypothetical protein ARTHRO9AX_10294 [Arthrobacter sp. 9AX]|nr:hypothetical protein ARTHRO9AX_10294 [Arthrobacter sp. 9AX]
MPFRPSPSPKGRAPGYTVWSSAEGASTPETNSATSRRYSLSPSSTLTSAPAYGNGWTSHCYPSRDSWLPARKKEAVKLVLWHEKLSFPSVHSAPPRGYSS